MNPSRDLCNRAQFFDHGLDLTSKGGSGVVMIPLSPDDPLYVPGSPTNFMMLTRATNQPGPDGIVGTADDIREHNNQTTPWVDLNQVYTSNASHQVFLREYVMVGGRPVATGHMLEGAAGGPPTWADIKAQAKNMLGIELGDERALDVPLLLTDLYGEFVRGADGFPILMTAGGPISASGVGVGETISAFGSFTAGRAFLDDIAHTANPARPGYDGALLDAHFIVGDGRGNENIALTSVHTLFHAEHNRQVDAVMETVLATGDLAFINEWMTAPLAALPAPGDTLNWDGERLFQAARFSTEMVYQHLVFEEFARALAPQIDAFLFSNTVEIDPAISQEFAQVVYRFGHSMLTETVDILGFAGGAADPREMGLIEAFLNPLGFLDQGDDAQSAAGAILRGMTRQTGSEIDEFMVSALRNNLVGLPLDLATLNMARARDTGVPSLNEARRQFYEQTNDTYLKPYESWTDFAQNIKNPYSIINFIAAYGTHGSILSATTMAEKRDAATALVLGTATGTATTVPADRLAFLNSTGAWANQETGLNLVDFWIGGLAEAKMAFGGMLGSTFTFVFENQLENLQEGDRFYYLSRTQGMNLLAQLEADSMASLIRRNTDTEDVGLHINANAFKAADFVIEMDQSKQFNPGLGSADPDGLDPILGSMGGSASLVQRGPNFLRFLGDQHVVLGGTNADETIIGGLGDDAIWGEGGHDRLEGGYGVDHIFGGSGNDIITDAGSDIGALEKMHGDEGDDVINAGMGLDLIFGGTGQDFIIGGTEDKDVFGGEGNDFIMGGSGFGVLAGNEGDDWIEGGDSFDTLIGEHSELFFNSRIIGHDVMNGRGNDTDYDAESGDDIMFQGSGIQRNNGMAGFDWTIYQGVDQAADADMNVKIFVNQQNNILRDRFDLVEGLSGWIHSDRLIGREFQLGAFDEQAGNAAQPAARSPLESYTNYLYEHNVSLINGLAPLVAHLERFDVEQPNTGETLVAVMDTSDGSDIILGGGGSDSIEGRAGDDIIDGDRWMQVRIQIDVASGPDAGRYFADHMTAQVVNAAGQVMFGGKRLDELMFDRTLSPGQLSINRTIADGGQSGDIDTAFYWDVRANYEVTRNDDGSYTVEHVDASEDGFVDPGTGQERVEEGTDRLFNIEYIEFSDQRLFIGDQPTQGAPVLSDMSPTRTFEVTADTSLITDPDGIASIALQWQMSTNGGTTWTNITGATGASFTPGNAQVNNLIRVAATVTDLNGTVRVVNSAASETVGNRIDGSIFGNNIVGTAGADLLFGGGGTDTITGAAGDDTISGGTGNDQSTGGAGNDQFVGGFGNDTFAGGEGDDAAFWGVTNPLFVIAGIPFGEVSDGRDLITGGDGGTDTFVVEGNNTAETYRVYARAAWIAAGNSAAGINAATEIVITRNGTTAGSIIAELAGIEEIDIRTGAGNDTVIPIGNFDPTSLSFSTITVNGTAGDDTVDVSHLVSAHRIRFRTGGGNDLIVGTLSSEDIIELPPGSVLANFSASTDAQTGLTTLTDGTHTVRFTAGEGETPQVVVGTAQPVLVRPEDEPGVTGPVIEGTDETDVLDGTSASESIHGLGGDDRIDGQGGTDALYGGDGNDTIRGGMGDDHLDGGEGDDVLRDEGGSNRIDGAGGNDRLRGGANADTMTGGTGDDTIDGEGGDDEMQGGDGDDRLRGDGGADTLAGDGGNDTLAGGDGDDGLGGGAGDDLVYSGSGNDVVAGGAGNDRAYGDDGADMMAGEDGDDRLDGGDGDDTIDGGTGDDSLVGRSGSDLLIGGDGRDHLTGGDDADRLFGGEGNDTADGGGADDVLAGQSGDDLVFGRDGNDKVYGGDGNDRVYGDDGDDRLYGDNGDDRLYAGSGNDQAHGGAGDDFIQGNDGNDHVSGGEGNDLLAGADGNDKVAGGDGDDRVYGGHGDDMLFGGAGNDVVDGGEGSDQLAGQDGDDVLFGRDGDDRIYAGDGNDVLYGGDGADRMFGETGDDRLWAGAGNDMLRAGDGADILDGGNGDDTLEGGAGADLLMGGAGADTFCFRSAAEVDGDTIRGHQGDDVIDLSRIDANGAGAGNAAFQLLASGATPVAGSLLVSETVIGGRLHTIVSGHLDADGTADFTLALVGRVALGADDFLL
jgi:Ca2+-binding RTX toxin-like protein